MHQAEKDRLLGVTEPIQRFDGSKTRRIDVQVAIDLLSSSGVEARGAVYTKTEIVDFMLDLIDYRSNQKLQEFRLLEPSFGDGDFFLPAVERLLTSYTAQGGSLAEVYPALKDCMVGIELHQETYRAAQAKVYDLLYSYGLSKAAAGSLCNAWLIRDDFLLADFSQSFTHVVGNPPYVRQERVPDSLLKAYRENFATLFDRADLYIPFFERSLNLLIEGGRLSFICSDRWMKNRYGGPLRELIARNYHVESYVDMFGTDAFRAEVSAYPAITTIVRGHGHVTRVAKRPKIDKQTLARLASALTGRSVADDGVEVIPKAVKSRAPWLMDCAAQLKLIRKLEDTCLPLEHTGCKVGIGVASGLDRVYIAPYDELDVEESRKLPLLMALDIRSGRVEWGGKGIINPFEDSGEVVNLADYPRLRRYLMAHEEAVRGRHVARRNPKRWYRTIDRITKSLTYLPKLLIPDIKDEPNVVLDEGNFYPHHNLYWITSERWDRHALQTVLRSSVAKLFVWAYSVKMRGGYLRYQAQNLRRIVIPKWSDVPKGIRVRLTELAKSDDKDSLNEIVFELYGLTESDRFIVKNLTQARV